MFIVIRFFSYVWRVFEYGVWVCVASILFVFGVAAAGSYFMIGAEDDVMDGVFLVYVWTILSLSVWAWMGLLVRLVSARRENACLLRQVYTLFRISVLSLELSALAASVCLVLTSSEWKDIAWAVILICIIVLYVLVIELPQWRDRGKWRDCHAQNMRDLLAKPISGVVEFAAPGLTFSAVSSRFQALAEHDPAIRKVGEELLECEECIKIRRQKESDDWVFVYEDGSGREFSPALRRRFARFHDVVFDAEWRYDLVDGFGFYRAGVLSLYPTEAAEVFRTSYMSTLLGSPAQFEAWLREWSRMREPAALERGEQGL